MVTSDPSIDPSIASLPYAKRLKVRRIIAGIRQDELAAALKIHPSLLNHYEQGARTPADPPSFEIAHRQMAAKLMLPAPAT